MTSTHRALATSLALAGALIGAGCTQPSTAPAETTTTSTSTTPAPTPTTSSPPALTPQQQDEKDAEQAVTKLIDVANIVGTNPDETLNQLATVARGKSLAFWRESTFRQRAVKESQTGEIKVVTSSANLESENIYKVPACLDVSSVDILDANGQSTITPDRLPKSGYTYRVEKTPDGFFVTDEEATGAC